MEPNPTFSAFPGGVLVHNFKNNKNYPLDGSRLTVLEKTDVNVLVGGLTCDVDGIMADKILISLPGIDQLQGLYMINVVLTLRQETLSPSSRSTGGPLVLY